MNYYPAQAQFLETVGRERAATWADLDLMKTIWNGPTSLADDIPSVGSPHPTYQNMEVSQSRKLSEVAGMTRWEIDYVGLFSGATVGPIAFDDSVSEQELDFQQFYITTVLNPGSPPTIPAFSTYLVGSITSVIRYEGRSDILRYVAKGKPTGPRFQSLASPTILSSFVRPNSRSAATSLGSIPHISYAFSFPDAGGPQAFSSGPAGGVDDIAQYIGPGPWGYSGPNIYCSQFSSRSISPNWYRCQEVWSIRYLPGTQFTI